MTFDYASRALPGKTSTNTEWSYAGFFFDVLVATAAHPVVHDGQAALSAIALIATMVSRIYDGVLTRQKEVNAS
jgi:hypothetical protein